MTTWSPRCARSLGILLLFATLLAGAAASFRADGQVFPGPTQMSATTQLSDLVDALPDALPAVDRLTTDRLATDRLTERAGGPDLPIALLGGAVLLLLPAAGRVLGAGDRRRLPARPLDVPRGRGPPTRG